MKPSIHLLYGIIIAMLFFASCGDDEEYDYPIRGSIECPMDDSGEGGSFRWEGECGTTITDSMTRCPKCKTSVRYIKALEKEMHIGVKNGESLDEIQDRLRSIDVPK